MAMALGRHLPLLFILLFIVSAVGLGFSADLVHERRQTGYGSDKEKHRIRYSLFCGVFGVTLSLVFLGFAFISSIFSWMAHGTFVFLNWIFWLANALALHFLYGGVVRCGGVGRIGDGVSECHKIKTIEIVSWVNMGLSFILWIAFVTIGRRDHSERHGRRGNAGYSV